MLINDAIQLNRFNNNYKKTLIIVKIFLTFN